MSLKTESTSHPSLRKPRLSLFFATACYAGYLPKAPGTWGSLVGVLLYWAVANMQSSTGLDVPFRDKYYVVAWRPFAIEVATILAFVGVWASSRVARWSGQKDPQFVVIDEVSGQFFTYLAALVLFPLNWKYLALGFILFRVFDIWKPIPVQQAESLPGGWGIMADDWVAAVYAAIGIWIVRALGL